MPTNLIDGRVIARQILNELAGRIASLRKQGCTPGLAFVRVGDDPASKVYVSRKEKACQELGIYSETSVLPETTQENELLDLLARLNSDQRLNGILVQAPLPAHIHQSVVFSTVSPDNDVNGFH